MPLPLRARLQKHVSSWPWRRVSVLAGISFVLALMLVIYLFGVSDHFFGRLFSAFFVWFWLLVATFLGVLPFISWATTHWFGASWRGGPTPAVRRPAAPVVAKAAGRRS